MVEMYPVKKLRLDMETIYPRAAIDASHVGHMVEAKTIGEEMPPIIVDRTTKTIVDGYHRYHAAVRCKEERIAVAFHEFESPAAMLLASIRLNARHGRAITPYDRTHCIVLAARFQIDMAEVASALAISLDHVVSLRHDRVGSLEMISTPSASPGEPVALKRTVAHMAGRIMSREQVEVHKKLCGHDQLFIVNQLVLLVESGLYDLDDERLRERLAYLVKLIDDKEVLTRGVRLPGVVAS